MSTGVEFWWQVRRSLSVVMTLRECGEIDLGHMTGELADIVMGGFGILMVNGDLWEKELGSGHGGKWGHVVLIGDGPKAEQNDWQASFRAMMAVFRVRWRRSTIPLACGW